MPTGKRSDDFFTQVSSVSPLVDKDGIQQISLEDLEGICIAGGEHFSHNNHVSYEMFEQIVASIP